MAFIEGQGFMKQILKISSVYTVRLTFNIHEPGLVRLNADTAPQESISTLPMIVPFTALNSPTRDGIKFTCTIKSNNKYNIKMY